ncbi:competence ComEA-like helix-hairpin-helix protein [Orenia metallireducens]|uniref:Competence protein ComEA helix-hairpin-helix repeat region n=1 Tax=Orenia metallireducens TaxID=1413210 RepID=A0A285I4J9_9FIRM|nr:helix-hairpin-helix domain-containing protein [Orenia metallireducens]PRX23223.1 competence ComEA-like helix-hairpin-helix protein [Orenia metallireducens]SNY41861.1 competence protein ComEA helix-hairpin-helix repeat region [Orenia metallireducens]
MVSDLSKDKFQAKEFHIAFIGAIKAGKSTLINTLLGKEVSSVSVTPETAVLTKFRASKEKDYVKIKFHTQLEWNKLWKSIENSHSNIFKEEYIELNAEAQKCKWIGFKEKYMEFDNDQDLINEIKRWTSSKGDTHYFVKEVEVGLKALNYPEYILLVDTPGLDDPVKYRSDITQKYINKADAIIVCIKGDSLTGQELSTIYNVFATREYKSDRIYVVGTQLDKLNTPNDDWKKQRDEWLKHLKNKEYFGSIDLAERNLFSVSAYLYNLLVNFSSLNKDTIDFELTPIIRKFKFRDIENNIDQLKELSGIDNLNNRLKSEIISKSKQFMLEEVKEDKKGLDINQATKEELERLTGVGPLYAEKIIKYRTDNNGFKTINEIKKIKGIGRRKYNLIKEEITVNYRKLDINAISLEALQKLEGIGKVCARRVIDYRTENEKFKNIKEIRKVKGIGPYRYSLIYDYIEY